jgi:hypothetical protein
VIAADALTVEHRDQSFDGVAVRVRGPEVTAAEDPGKADGAHGQARFLAHFTLDRLSRGLPGIGRSTGQIPGSVVGAPKEGDAILLVADDARRTRHDDQVIADGVA